MISILSSLRSLPGQLCLAIIASLLLGPHLPFSVLQGVFTISCIIKNILIAVLPFIIFVYLFDALVGLDKKAPLLLLTILVMVFLSNFIGVMLAGGIAKSTFPFLLNATDSAAKASLSLSKVAPLQPMFNSNFPSLVSPNMAMFAGIIAGFGASMFNIKTAHALAAHLHKIVTLFLQKAFIPVLPLYVAGFILKLQYEGSLIMLIQSYFRIFLLCILVIIAYVSLMYYVGSGFKAKAFKQSLKHMLPAGITAFSTMSSAATMPITLEACEKNLKNPRFADLIVPTTVNIHLIGDVLAIPITGLALLWFQGIALPDTATYIYFAVMFAIAKFSCAGIPGGGVIIILPILERHLGLSGDMLSMMTTIYILQDSIFTGSNVMGNGGFAMIVERIARKLFGGDDQPPSQEPLPVTALKEEPEIEACVQRSANTP